MANDWLETTLGELLSAGGGSIKTGPFGTVLKAAEYTNDGVPLISVREVGYGILRIDEKTPRVPAAVTARLADYLLQSGDIVFGRKGAVDRLALIRPWEDGYFLGSDGIRLRLPPSADPRFMLYQLLGEKTRTWLIQHATGTTMPSLNQGIIERLPVTLPPLPLQKTIAHILGTLDDKIELNRRKAETLEAMSLALFKSWFVDFDPVRAKAEGRDPGLTKNIAVLFPDSFQTSKAGKIPEGWHFARLPDVIDVNPTRSLRSGDMAPYLDMANMPTDGHSPECITVRPFGSGMRFTNGDTLVARITPCLENGKTAFVDFLQEKEIGWGSTEYIVLRPKPPLPNEFAYCLARSQEFRDFAIQSMTGSSGRQRVSTELLNHYNIAFPTDEVGNAFGKIVKPLFERGRCVSEENRVLTDHRNLLIPKLISGELRIR